MNLIIILVATIISSKFNLFQQRKATNTVQSTQLLMTATYEASLLHSLAFAAPVITGATPSYQWSHSQFSLEPLPVINGATPSFHWSHSQLSMEPLPVFTGATPSYQWSHSQFSLEPLPVINGTTPSFHWSHSQFSPGLIHLFISIVELFSPL